MSEDKNSKRDEPSRTKQQTSQDQRPDDQALVTQLLQLKQKNLDFFQRVIPGIYDYFSQYELQRVQLDIQPQNNELDLIENGKHVYNGGIRYAFDEADHFLNSFDCGTKMHSVSPLYEGEYKNPRYFAKLVDQVYRCSPLTKERYSGYAIPDFFPMLVFMGVGLGAHVQQLINSRQVEHVCIVETDMDRFAASLYVTDWEALALPFLQDKSRSFNFILIPDEQNELAIRNEIWNKLIEYCPVFPVMTLYYNHLGNPLFDRIISSLNADLYVHLFSFGNYDDELNQLNNAVHNFKRGIKKITKPHPNGVDFPVCIVGSGPSLDARAEWIKTNREKLIIFSCGTALTALHSHGIQPDFQIELESDYNTFATQSLHEDKEFMRQVRLVGAAQLSPKMFSLFEQSRLFFKAEGFLQGFFAEPGEGVKEAAPTCTNAALALAFHFSFSKVFLFGLDYGFPDKDSHHSKGALYYKEDGPQGLRDATNYSDNELIQVPGASGGTVLTTNFLYASKRRTENMLCAAQHPHVYNCSNGSHIERTEYLSSADAFNSALLNSVEVDHGVSWRKHDVIALLFSDSAESLAMDEVAKQIQELRFRLEDLVIALREILSDSGGPEGKIETSIQLTKACYRINLYLQETVKQQSESFYYFIRGSIWHFLHAGFTHSLAIENSAEKRRFIRNWQSIFDKFLMNLVSHYCSIINVDVDDSDPLISRSISQPETPDVELSLEYAQWSFTYIKMNELGEHHLLVQEGK